MNRMYIAPQTEIIELQADSLFLGSNTGNTSFSTTASFGESRLENGGDI